MGDITTISLDQLWRDVAPSREAFDSGAVDGLPEPARRYLTHAIADGTPLASAVRLEMAGEIALGGRWAPFRAEQVIRWDRGLIWQASTRMGPLPIRGWDRFIDGQGAMRWKLLGLIPVVRARGPDVSRSAAGRMQAESIWLPSALLAPGVRWRSDAPDRAVARVSAMGYEAEVSLTVDARGRLERVALSRWGNPGGGPFAERPFGALVEGEATFGGYTIPTRLRVGWHPSADGFEGDGEFWRATITSARWA